MHQHQPTWTLLSSVYPLHLQFGSKRIVSPLSDLPSDVVNRVSRRLVQMGEVDEQTIAEGDEEESFAKFLSNDESEDPPPEPVSVKEVALPPPAPVSKTSSFKVQNDLTI